LLGRLPTFTGSPPVRDVRFSVLPEPGTTFGTLTGTVAAMSVTISPDGRYLAFPAMSDGRTQLWLRDLGATTSRLISGTEDVRYHFWSPDSRSIGFTARGQLKVVGLDGTPPVERATINRTARGGTWSRDGSIIVNRSPDTGLFRVSADGSVTPVFQPTAGTALPMDLFPYALGDGRHMLFVHRDANPQQRGLYVSTISGERRTRLVDGSWGPIAVGDTVLYQRGSTLVMQRLDVQGLRLVGEPVVVLDAVANSTGGYMAASISETGTLAYADPWPTTGELGWYSRGGDALGAPLVPPGDYVDLSLSPSGDAVAFSRVDGQSTVGDVWLLDLSRGVTTRFTNDPMNDAGPTWAPDGSRIVFRSNRRGTNELFAKDVSGAQPEVLIAKQLGGLVLRGEQVSNGHLLITNAGETIDILDLNTSTGALRPIAQSAFDEYHPALSPDGRWLAFVSEETGVPEVYVQAYPEGDRRLKVTASGGSEPLWRADGRELYFIAPDRSLVAVPVGQAQALTLGAPVTLFRTRVPVSANAYRRQYVVAKDGRFLVNNAPLSARPPAIHVVLDWRALLPPGAR
jgi:Tol biopolymer transport system component